MKEYLVKSKDYEIKVIADSPKDAFVPFFKGIIEDNVSLTNLGHIAMIKEDDEEYAIRTSPILVMLGYLNRESAIIGISNLLSISMFDAEDTLIKCMKEDKWIADKILNL